MIWPGQIIKAKKLLVKLTLLTYVRNAATATTIFGRIFPGHVALLQSFILIYHTLNTLLYLRKSCRR